MKRLTGFFMIFIFIFCFPSSNTYAQSAGKGPVNIPGIAVVKASLKEAPPAWAVMQRQLIKTMEDGVPVYLNKFTRRGGTLYGRGPWDDVAEMFFNWSLFYAIGADEKLLNSSIEEYNALVLQCSYRDKQLYKEFTENDDWFHIAEGLSAFYDMALGDPTIPENIERAKRFAGFYMNEDPENTRNYDPVHKLIPYIFTGSKGPREKSDPTYMVDYKHMSLYPIVKEEFKKDWKKDQKRFKEIEKIYNDVVNRCDIPINLNAVGLITNAYLYTGDEKYKKWVLEYVDAWIERIKQNNGIIPDNIGQSGKIGEYRNGQWWGGFFGWSGTFGVHMIFDALTVASECAYLVSADPHYLYLLRSQIDVLFENSKITKEGELTVPYKYGQDGWYSYRPMRINCLAHLWNESMDPGDWQKVEKVIDGSKFHPTGYSGYWGLTLYDKKDILPFVPARPFDWTYVSAEGDRDIDDKEEFPRLYYYAGKNPDWPLNIMKADYQEVVKRMEFMRNDTRSIYSINADDLYPNNPIITKGLVQVTMGAPKTIYNGGLLRARVRYFDIDNARPGLPQDVAALVEKLEDKLTTVRLVNLSVTETRKLIIQAGAFGEHEFTNVSYKEKNTDKTLPVNKKFFAVELPPSSTIVLEMGMNRYVNKPTYAFPWHGDKLPVK